MTQHGGDNLDRSTSKTLLIGLSGPSSSGKTTLARMLRTILNIPASAATNNRSLKLFILHEDDFYKTDTQIPRKTFSSPEHGTRDLDDWDCVESLDLPLLESTLKHVKTHGRLPPDMFSKEDQNEIGESGVAESEIETYHTETRAWFAGLAQSDRALTLVILDGFLLYPSPISTDPLSAQLNSILESLLALKLFLPSTRSKTITRRARRTGYVTLEGFWADPPGYVEDVVWPNFVADHAWMFGSSDTGEVAVGSGGEEKEQDVQRNADEGRVNRHAAEQAGLLVGPGVGDRMMSEILQWAVQRVHELVVRELSAEQ